MKLLFKQRLFSWFDSYDIYNEKGEIVYVVKGQLSWGHCLKIFAANGQERGTVKQQVLTFLPKFEIYLQDQFVGQIHKEFSFFKPQYRIDYKNWEVEGDIFEWDYCIVNERGQQIARISKQLLNFTDTYELDIGDPDDALDVLMLVLAIDAEKCSRD
ncbi:MAG: LURP-one-related/scramblase family protein [Faecalibacillus sp.]